MGKINDLSEKMEASVNEFLNNVGDYEDTATLVIHSIDGFQNEAIDGKLENIVNAVIGAMFDNPQVALALCDSVHAYEEMCRVRDSMVSYN